MVFNTTKMAKMPFSNATHTTHTKVMIGRGLGTALGASMGSGMGSGMGSVLLRTGGGGAGSSYSDMDDYISTTGINPYARAISSGSGLKGMSRLSEKLSKLSITPASSKKKNIVMSI